MKSLGQTIHEARKQSEKTLQVLGKQVGVSPALLSLTEQEKHVPPRTLIVKLARALKADPDVWCGMIGRVTPKAEAALAKIAVANPVRYRKVLKSTS